MCAVLTTQTRLQAAPAPPQGKGAGCPTPRLARGASCCSAVTDWIVGGGRSGDMSVRLRVCLKGCFCCSVTWSCLILCDPMDCSTPGFPVPHHLPEFAQHHIHCIGDAIQLSHPLTPSSSALNLSQHPSLFQRVSHSHQVTKILELRL